MELQTYLAILWRRKVTLFTITLLVLIGAAVATFLARPTYVSATTLRAITIGGDALSGRTDPVYTERLLSTYAAIVTGGTVLNELTQRFNLPQRPVISVDLVRGTELMRIRAQATDPAIARDLANAAAEILIHQAREQFSSSGQSCVTGCCSFLSSGRCGCGMAQPGRSELPFCSIGQRLAMCSMKREKLERYISTSKVA
jgi:capsular polysaccharide biosynthesis protein